MAQYIKTVDDKGNAHYRKPREKNKDGSIRDGYNYKPAKKNKNTWRFHNIANISQEVWKAGQEYMYKMQDSSQRPRRRNKNPALVTKVFYWLYLSGARQQEAFKKPYPTLRFQAKADEAWIEVSHLNQKRKKDKKEVISYILPIFDEFERSMWNFISDGGQETKAENIFKYNDWTSTSQSNISHIFERAFKATLVNTDDPDRRPIKDEGIPPHLLRHMRAYDVLVNHSINKTDVQKMFGWKSDIMVYYYADINEMLTKEEQLKRYREAGVLTNLTIDAGKNLISEPNITA